MSVIETKMEPVEGVEEEVEEMEEPRPASAHHRMSLRTNAARQVAVNFVPSRQLPHNTIRLRRNNSEHNVLAEAAGDSSPEQQADIIVREMEQHRKLMEDNPVSEELRREALRDLPQCMTMKRHVRAKLSASVSLRSKRRPISWSRRLQYRLSFAWKRFRERIRDALFSIELWYEAIRHIEGHFGSAVGSYFRAVRRLFVLDAALAALLLALLVVPQALHDRAAPALGPLDWITAEGGLSNSLLFYGHYHSDVLLTAGEYNMPYAYFFTMLALYLIFFIILCYRTADSYRRNFIETAGGLNHMFANKVFCGWDFGIVSEHAANLNSHNIYNELKELLNEQTKSQCPPSLVRRYGQYSVNVLISVCAVGATAGAVWALRELLARRAAAAAWPVLVSALVTAIVALCPILFHFVVRLEFYKPRTALYVTLARTWLLDISVLMLLFIYWLRSNVQCWETRFGQEAYRLVLLDAVVSLIILPAIEIFRALLYKMNPKGSGPEFNIAYNSLTLIYNQTVLWFGMLFSPLLALVVAIKFLLLFYVKKECALRACQPARKVWRASQTQTVLNMLVTLSLFTTLFVIGSLFLGMSSPTCGPFRSFPSVVGVVAAAVPAARAAPLGWLLRPGVVAFLALLLGVCVYLCRARARAQRCMVTLLRHMLVLQARDKDFLLTAIQKVASGEWHYTVRSPDGPDSHTFKFLREVRKPSNSNFHFEASRPRSYAKENRPTSNYTEKRESCDGDTDSSFSWQGSSNRLNEKEWI